MPTSTPLTAAADDPQTAVPTTHVVARLRPADLLRAISRIRRTASLYGRGHPVIERFVGDAFDLIASLLGNRPSIGIFIHEDTFLVDNTILLEESLQLASLLGEFKRRDISSLEIRSGLELGELRCFVDMLTKPAPDVQHLGGAAAYLSAQGVRHLAVSNAVTTPTVPQAGLRVEPGDAYRAGVRVIDELYSQASNDHALSLHRARIIVDSLIDILTKDPTSLMRAAIIKNYDANTAHHSVNVGILSLFMASRLGFDRDLTSILGISALLHDIGKVRIPLPILNKVGTLSDEERAVVQQHPINGAHMLRGLAGPSRLAMVVAFEHHANYDLSGYPRITTKQHPHLLARLVQTVDVFDAMTSSRRSYRRPQSPDEAMRFIVGGAGAQFDPALARIFLEEMGVYPIGTLVQLDDGAMAMVRRAGRQDPARPLVSVIDARAASPAVLFDLNLEESADRHIVRSVTPDEAGIDVANVQLPPDE